MFLPGELYSKWTVEAEPSAEITSGAPQVKAAEPHVNGPML